MTEPIVVTSTVVDYWGDAGGGRLATHGPTRTDLHKISYIHNCCE